MSMLKICVRQYIKSTQIVIQLTQVSIRFDKKCVNHVYWFCVNFSRVCLNKTNSVFAYKIFFNNPVYTDCYVYTFLYCSPKSRIRTSHVLYVFYVETSFSCNARAFLHFNYDLLMTSKLNIWIYSFLKMVFVTKLRIFYLCKIHLFHLTHPFLFSINTHTHTSTHEGRSQKCKSHELEFV
jgi:hypothetical protein